MAFFSGAIKQFQKAGKSVEFWDIGSHAGLYSVYLATHCDLKVLHAFEPDPRSYAQLNANLFINHMTDRIQVHKVAASNAEKQLRFFMAVEGNRGASRISTEGKENVIGETVINAVCLDNYLQPTCDVIALKIDVEEHEREVIEGMSATLRSQNVFMQMEIFEENEAVMFPILEEYGLKLIGKVNYDHYFVNFDFNDTAFGSVDLERH